MLPRTKHTLANVSESLKAHVQPNTHVLHVSVDDKILCEGWLLKKRRKKLQGYARRYFVLLSSGTLRYSFEPGSEIRDQISLFTAAISSTPGRKDIHVDSERVTFHIKCLTSQEFDLWIGMLRKFTPSGSEAQKTMRQRSMSRPTNYANAFQHATLLVDEMGRTIDDLSVASKSIAIDEDRSLLSFDMEHPGYDKHKGRESLSVFSRLRKPSSPLGNSSFAQTYSKDLPTPPNGPATLRPHERLEFLLKRLHEQHESLSESLSNMSVQSYTRFPMQRSANEDMTAPPTILNSHSLQHLGTLGRASISSAMTSTDGTASMWYDAEDFGAEEYVVEGEPDITSVQESVQEDGKVNRNDDSEEESLASNGSPKGISSVMTRWRSHLPSKAAGDEGSLFAILRKNVGQDLSNISFPVSFNEPLTLLQRQAEEFEYYGLLEKAVATSDWLERICYVAAFAVSAYASTKFRSGRKGFTPLLGETFEDSRMNFIAEKVVHKPLVIAYHADGPGWELNATSSGNTKFWGKSFEIIPTGITRLKIGKDEYEWNKPSSFTRNLMMGVKYLEHIGQMVVKNTSTGVSCVLDFKETGYWGSTPNVVSGSVLSPDGQTVSKLEGKWDEQLAQKLDSNHLKVLWKISPFPRNASDYYGFTYFGITLNEITPDMEDKLPPTDSRLRPDVRALENGDVTLADDEKTRLEQTQRERRQRGQDPRPRWFKQVGSDGDWVYTGGYWEARRNGWKNSNVMPLW